MTWLERMRREEQRGHVSPLAVVGTGFMGRALVARLHRTPGLRTALVVSRRPEPGVRSLVDAGFRPGEVLLSADAAELREAIRSGRPAVTCRADVLAELPELRAVVETTGAVEYGAQVALHAISGGAHVIMVNAETDATVGPALRRLADEAKVVYTGADGDQPAVLKRLVDFAEAAGLGVRAALNCKGFLDVHATPPSIVEWARRQRTSLRMTTAFTDGTKLSLENAVLANATGLRPARRGMVGVPTTLARALEDCLAAIPERGVVDYTLGGDFGGSVLLIAEAGEADMARDYLRYYKMGDGPCYLLQRPYHLCHLEVAATVAEALLDGVATIAPRGVHAEVIATAKTDLRAGRSLDGIGGFTCYGQIDTAAGAAGLLPMGLAEEAVLTRDVRRDEPIPLEAVELDSRSTLVQLRQFQHELDDRGVRRTAA
jgi:predicted homoserine dehydrogenase-like protein